MNADSITAQYGNATRPKSKSEKFSRTQSTKERVRKRWAQAEAVALRAGSDDTSDDEECEDIEVKRQQKLQREKFAQTMVRYCSHVAHRHEEGRISMLTSLQGLQYFLEMVDSKHRYGSNLRRYHQEWMKSDTTENYFYWLDYGEGKDLDLEDRPRKRLDTEQVRYLSREERALYQVRIDVQGRFCWVKDGRPITTSPSFKDSVRGIVPENENVPTWREVTTGEKQEPPSDSSSLSSGISTGSAEDGSKYVNEEIHDANGLAKINHLSVDALMNHLLRKTTKKNTWIFVADTSFRLYIGIKQSGAFQHSSFLKGARVSAAGLIKIKRGQIRKISPLSGHYAPPVRNFREFLKSLKAAGADLSRLNVSRSYAVILGLEGYIRVKKRAQNVGQKTKDVLNPEEARKREEANKDKSQSAQREREILEKEASARRRRSATYRFKKKLGIHGKGEGETDIGPPGKPSVDERPE